MISGEIEPSLQILAGERSLWESRRLAKGQVRPRVERGRPRQNKFPDF